LRPEVLSMLINNSFKSILLIFMSLLLAMPLGAALSDKPRSAVLPQPEENLQPEDVVRIVIVALANNDWPFLNAGIATTFNFASPENKRNTGPLEKFTKMLKGGVYEVMVQHRQSEFSEVVLQGNRAYQFVTLTTDDGSIAVFAFRLSKQVDGQYRDMWMTDAVWPVSKSSSF